MPFYEIRVAGPIGPVVASIFPGFTITALPTSTVVSGTVADVEELLAVMNLARLQGFSPFDAADET
jgi:hypothetical protein